MGAGDEFGICCDRIPPQRPYKKTLAWVLKWIEECFRITCFAYVPTDWCGCWVVLE